MFKRLTLEELYEQYPELRDKCVRLDKERLPVGLPKLVFRTAERIHAQLRVAEHNPPIREEVDARLRKSDILGRFSDC